MLYIEKQVCLHRPSYAVLHQLERSAEISLARRAGLLHGPERERARQEAAQVVHYAPPIGVFHEATPGGALLQQDLMDALDRLAVGRAQRLSVPPAAQLTSSRRPSITQPFSRYS